MPAAPRIAAVRGAIQVPANRAEDIRASTARLLGELVRLNALRPERIVSAIFTATPDLTADFPAHAARKLGWTDVPLLGATEVDVPGALPRIVRVLLTVEVPSRAPRLSPVYLDGAEALRPDLARAKSAAQGETKRVALIGIGQIGGSIGLALGRAGGWERVGFDRNARTMQAALMAGAIDRAAPSLEAACADAEIAVVAVPVDVLPATIDRVAKALPRGSVLIDTGSARRGVTEALARAAKIGVRAIGGHPIAGNEGHGFASARVDLFTDASFVVLRVNRNPVPRPARDFIAALGAREVASTPAAHDRALARTSHLPYLVSRAIERSGRGAARAGLAGPGFRGMTRLAKSDERVALAYCRANAEAIRTAWRELERSVARSMRGLGLP